MLKLARKMHAAGYGVILHYHESESEAEALRIKLNEQRQDSAWKIKANFQSNDETENLIHQTVALTGRLDVLVNNASSFYATPVETAKLQQWDDITGANLRAPFFLSLAARDVLKKTQGCVINIVDIYAKSALSDFSIYSISKSGLSGLTHALAKELAPEVRVNGISPGVILWPEESDESYQQQLLQQIPLNRSGEPLDIANAVLFLVENATYITGQIISVDGGKGLN